MGGGYKYIDVKSLSEDLYLSAGSADTPRLRFRGFTDPWQRKKLAEVFFFKTDRIDHTDLGINSYISTENMLPDFQGVEFNLSSQSSMTPVKFGKGDVLMANIRPYLKKVWLADRNGGCSTDVVVFSYEQRYDSQFLYRILANDRFIDYVMESAQGVKMPRGNKEAMRVYSFYIPSLAEQERIGEFFRSQDEGIAAVGEQVERLRAMKQACLERMFA